MTVIQGEWWLIDGRAHFADGDVGDLNHVAFVWNALCGEMAEAIVERWDEAPSWVRDLASDCRHWVKSGGGDPVMFRCNVNDCSDLASRGYDESPWWDDPNGWLCGFVGWDETKYGILTNDGDEQDARLWAMEHWGWSRFAGNSIETFGLDGGKLEQIAEAVFDCAVEGLVHARFTLEVTGRSGGRRVSVVYDGVPWQVLSGGRVGALRDFLRH